MNKCALPVEAGSFHSASGLLWCGWTVVVLDKGCPHQRLSMIKAGWPHRFLDALQVWDLNTCSCRPNALITGWIHHWAWKQRSSWGKWHQRSTGVTVFKRSWAACQASCLKKRCPPSPKSLGGDQRRGEGGRGAVTKQQLSPRRQAKGFLEKKWLNVELSPEGTWCFPHGEPWDTLHLPEWCWKGEGQSCWHKMCRRVL